MHKISSFFSEILFRVFPVLCPSVKPSDWRAEGVGQWVKWKTSVFRKNFMKNVGTWNYFQLIWFHPTPSHQPSQHTVCGDAHIVIEDEEEIRNRKEIVKITLTLNWIELEMNIIKCCCLPVVTSNYTNNNQLHHPIYNHWNGRRVWSCWRQKSRFLSFWAFSPQ